MGRPTHQNHRRSCAYSCSLLSVSGLNSRDAMPHHSIVTVPLAATLAMLYARLVAKLVLPGLIRLLCLAPALLLLLLLPFAIPLYSTRGTAAFFLTWLGEFKLLLLASGHGPLDPHLHPVPFVFTATLPVKLLQQQSPDATEKTKKVALPLPLLLSSSIKVAIMVTLLKLFNGKDQMHPYVAFTLYGIYIYCFLDFLLPCLAALGRALGMGLEPQFDRPYLSASLQDFWGRRWNLMASAVLRPAVYVPVRARLGAPAGVLATFLVSGLMHEVIACYITFRAPTGRLAAFFALHGAAVCAERWWCARRRWTRPPVPRVVATPMVVVLVVGTAVWLFFPPLFGGGMDDLFIAESDALLASLVDAGGRKRQERHGHTTRPERGELAATMDRASRQAEHSSPQIIATWTPRPSNAPDLLGFHGKKRRHLGGRCSCYGRRRPREDDALRVPHLVPSFPGLVCAEEPAVQVAWGRKRILSRAEEPGIHTLCWVVGAKLSRAVVITLLAPPVSHPSADDLRWGCTARHLQPTCT
ncbi:hypothetical protein HU200_043636 [Digitaria exilis]|uniref:Wax synthase domain-containing protein n=1 Tax=Digitaria exilis TaxID=1010633 RepID=A0A835B8R4_9POAL|nr:hypothetical protein HU200_043636 [Digitaria exilis]